MDLYQDTGGRGSVGLCVCSVSCLSYRGNLFLFSEVKVLWGAELLCWNSRESTDKTSTKKVFSNILETVNAKQAVADFIIT